MATLSFSLLSPHSPPKKQRSVKCFLTCLPAHAKIRAYRGADRTAGSSRNGGMRRRRRMRSPEGLFPPGRNQDGEIESFVARPRQRAPVAAGVFLQGRVISTSPESPRSTTLHGRSREGPPTPSICLPKRAQDAQRGRWILNRHAVNPQQDPEVIVLVLHCDRPKPETQRCCARINPHRGS